MAHSILVENSASLIAPRLILGNTDILQPTFLSVGITAKNLQIINIQLHLIASKYTNPLATDPLLNDPLDPKSAFYDAMIGLKSVARACEINIYIWGC